MKLKDLEGKLASIAEQTHARMDAGIKANEAQTAFVGMLPAIVESVIKPVVHAAFDALLKGDLDPEVYDNRPIMDLGGRRSVKVDNCTSSLVTLFFQMPPPTRLGDPYLMAKPPIVFLAPPFRAYITMYAIDPRIEAQQNGYVRCGVFAGDDITREKIEDALARTIECMVTGKALPAV